ncbi:MAG: hypothetical protein HOC70_04420 [Gammaproteobacteria bacterium]|jgi:nucleoside 2-deoxyribosyltransferase|nr:hypothetical protein [Gammaproteobacteria bacterium]
MTEVRCPLCKTVPEHGRKWDYGERTTVQCAVCGFYTITGTAVSIAERQNISHKLSAYTRDNTERGVDVPEINSNNLSQLQTSLPDYGVGDKQLLYMRALERRSKFPGSLVQVTPGIDYPLAWASGEEEFLYLLRDLLSRRLVAVPEGGTKALREDVSFETLITPAGWEYLEKHRAVSAISDQVFVAMSFSPNLQAAWEDAIRPAIVESGYKPYRIDDEPHVDRIDSKIIAEIRNSGFLVADVTEQRPGVYFEAGFALGLGLKVFWCVRSDDLEHVHFDTRQYNHIVWETEADLKEKLFYFVTSVAGKRTAT